MTLENNAVVQKTCFVVMGFGKKTDFETGRVLDLDKSYKNMIKPAVEAAGLQCVRADEIVHSGLIDVPMYEQLLNADVVVADLSTSNKNAFYELGIRHALRPFTTVIISEDGIKAFPFDISHVAVRQYHHMGDDIGFDEVMRFRALLTSSITEILKKNPVDRDSPVYTFINGLTPPMMEAVVKAAAVVQEGISQNRQLQGNSDASGDNDKTHSELMQQVEEAEKKEDWITAKALLSVVRQMMKPVGQGNVAAPAENPYILQQLALVTYKSKYPNERDALLAARQLLDQMAPDTSNDTETLGMWGSVHKRLWELDRDIQYLDEAIRAYGRGFYIRNDYYNGVNFAFTLNVRAGEGSDKSESIADYVLAGRVRKEVLQICQDWLTRNPQPLDSAPAAVTGDFFKTWFWVKAAMGEAYVGLGDETNAAAVLNEAYSKVPEDWMKATSEEQLGRLRPLLANSPLQFIKEV